jgi:hypothetical protein
MMQTSTDARYTDKTMTKYYSVSVFPVSNITSSMCTLSKIKLPRHYFQRCYATSQMTDWDVHAAGEGNRSVAYCTSSGLTVLSQSTIIGSSWGVIV